MSPTSRTDALKRSPRAKPNRSIVSSARCAMGRQARGSSTSRSMTSIRIRATRVSAFDESRMDHLKSKIREIPDFPKPGILFYDITTLLCDSRGFRDTVDALAAPYMGEDIDQVIGVESRGFILGAAVSAALCAVVGRGGTVGDLQGARLNDAHLPNTVADMRL